MTAMNQSVGLPYIHLIQQPQADLMAGLYGYHLPFLPDFLADHTLLSQNPVERLAEVLGRLEQLVTGLRKYRNAAYALRFIAQPGQGVIQVNLVGRILSSPSKVRGYVDYISKDLHAHLTGYGLPHLPLLQEAYSYPTKGQLSHQRIPSLAEVVSPFRDFALAEVRQHEAFIPFRAGNDENYYVIHPYQGAAGTCLEPFEVMLSQVAPSIISIYLEPTDLTEGEERDLSDAALIAQTGSDMEVRTYSDTSVRRWRDPGMELAARIYQFYQKSLAEPFVMVVQVASPDPNVALSVARSYASAIIPAQQSRTLDLQERFLPSKATPFLVDRAYASAAQRTLEQLIWSPGSEQRRFPYLVGSRAATTAFRFPVSVQGGVPGIAVRQMPPDFEPGPRPATANADEIHIGNYRRGGVAVAPLKALTRHALITGFTGSGKTNTVLYLLDQLWRKHHIPFLVIEAAKKEYRALKAVDGFRDLLIFTLGDETTSPFRFNPFELLPGVRLEAHLGRMQACFDAALPQFGILPSIVAEAMQEIYKAKNWRLTDTALPEDKRLFPTLRDMRDEVMQIAERRGYAGEILQNIRAAAVGRIGSLLQGSKGRMFNCQSSLPADVIFTSPVILELNDLNEEDKALTMMFLLMWLREYRELHKKTTLSHVTVVEEAHNVVSNVTSVGNTEISSDAKAKAVSTFSNMLSEIRAYGEGVIISDQSPEKLAPDAIRNTNLQIAHQLRDSRDRESIARAMTMEKAQQDYLGKLGIGEAALFMTGMEKAAFIMTPNYKDSAHFDVLPADDEVKQFSSPFRTKYQTAYLPFDGCRFCGSPCLYREPVESFSHEGIQKKLNEAILAFDKQPEPEHWSAHWRKIAEVCREAAALAGCSDQLDAGYCFLAHNLDYIRFTDSMRNSFAEAFRALE